VGFTFTRRAVLSAIPLVLSAQVKKAKPLPTAGEFTRLTDGVTENVIVRLTNPAYTNKLSGSGNAFVSLKERTLVFSSNRAGRLAPFQVDLRNGVLRQIAEAEKLDPRSLCLDRLQKSVYFLDGDHLCEAPLGKSGGQTLADGVTWFRLGQDGVMFAIRGGKVMYRESGGFKVVAGAEQAVECWPQPGGAGCLFARATGGEDSEFWYAQMKGVTQPAKLLAKGRIRTPFWDADGQSILFLRDVTDKASVVKAEIHQCGLSGEEKCLAPTSQFVAFSPNGDCSVFVGASRSHAQPNVLLMLRSPNREMTLCEHASKHPADVLPSFSPDSRRVYFESEHEGNPAIYSVNVEYLVEPIATGE
jgi:Tol biopolymer transport system component